MPYMPKKSYAYPGCLNLTHDRYCEKHQRQSDIDYDRYQRDPEYKLRYHNGTWRQIRKLFR